MGKRERKDVSAICIRKLSTYECHEGSKFRRVQVVVCIAVKAGWPTVQDELC